jgi:hypothetical protein
MAGGGGVLRAAGTSGPVGAATTWTARSGADAGGSWPGASCTLRQAIASAASSHLCILRVL